MFHHLVLQETGVLYFLLFASFYTFLAEEFTICCYITRNGHFYGEKLIKMGKIGNYKIPISRATTLRGLIFARIIYRGCDDMFFINEILYGVAYLRP